MGELLPCPFCGNDGSGPINDALQLAFGEHEWRGPSWTAQCDKCTATMGYFDSEDAVIEAWNTRTNLAADALIEAEKRGAERMRDRAAQYHDNFLMTCTGLSVERIVASTEAIRAMPLTEETPNDDA